MAKAKKTFDRELMYKKIMPTGSKKFSEEKDKNEPDENSSEQAEQHGNIDIRVDKIVINDENFDSSASDESVISINANSVYINSGLSYGETEEITEEEEAAETEVYTEAVKKEEASGSLEEQKRKPVLSAYKRHNIMENLVTDRLDITMNKMSCCRCSICRDDVAALALNALRPIYAVGTEEEIKDILEENNGLGLEVTSAILKAVLKVRKAPKH